MEKNKNIEMITGDPKKAINKLSLPIIASMFLIFANNIIDSIWVAGLGTEPLAALGYITKTGADIFRSGNACIYRRFKKSNWVLSNRINYSHFQK